jgi:uroporphyrin-III C-methyltransferase
MKRDERPRVGRVTLVGAGPGDPDLLTLRAVRALQDADVVLVDDLVDRRVLQLARDGARIVEVGKRGGCRSTPQQFIERLLVREARAGRRVVRLKGGDPFVFGRGGEEVSALAAHGIDVDVVPGVTAGIAAPAALAIPVTDRRHTHGVTFVTGHAREGVDGPDWHALARSGLTLVVYMGVARCAQIAARLLEGGLDPSTPAAAIQHAHTPRQRSVVSTAARLAGDIARAGLGAPAILVFGSVVALARERGASIPATPPAAARPARTPRPRWSPRPDTAAARSSARA